MTHGPYLEIYPADAGSYDWFAGVTYPIGHAKPRSNAIGTAATFAEAVSQGVAAVAEMLAHPPDPEA